MKRLWLKLMSKTKKDIIHYPTGQKYQEINYKDGEQISIMLWEEDENLIE